MRLGQSRNAQRDLDEIRDFSKREFGRQRALAYPGEIESAFRLIWDHPQVGVEVRGITPPVRSVPAGSHRVFYEIIGERIVVVRILHKAMDIVRHL